MTSFTDDCLIFTEASFEAVYNLLDVLEKFSLQSGQAINFEKSSVHFSKKTAPDTAAQITEILGVKTMTSKEKYLGSPLLLGHNKQEAFSAIKESFENRLTGWSSKSLTQAARSTMVKHVLNTIPQYQMSTFLIPSTLLGQLRSIQLQFFWSGNTPLTWEQLCVPKNNGGLAFRDLEKLNLALLTKLAWRVCCCSSQLWVQVLAAKYFNGGELRHQSTFPACSSWVWNGIEKGLKVVQENYFMEVNNGKGTKIWLDRWIPGILHPPISTHVSAPQYVWVSDLFYTGTYIWNIPLLEQLFDSGTAVKIQRMFIDGSQEDKMLWMPNRNGHFSVKSAYNKLTETSTPILVRGRVIDPHIWKSLWNSGVAHRVQLFIWKCLREANSTRVKLASYNAEIDTHCGSCGAEGETMEHIIFHCRHGRKVWRSVNVNIDGVSASGITVSQWMESWFSNNSYSQNEQWVDLLMIGSWIIWKDRCEAIFQGKSLNPISSVHRISFYLSQCMSSAASHVTYVHSNIAVCSPPSNWKLPPTNVLKINIDASFDIVTNQLGTACVIRNCEGICEGIRGSFRDGAMSP